MRTVLKNSIIPALAAVIIILGGCGEKPYLSVGDETYSKSEVEMFSRLFDYDGSMALQKFVEFALASRAAGDVRLEEGKADKAYEDLKKTVLQNLLREKARPFMDVLAQDAPYFAKKYRISYRLYAVTPEQGTAREDVLFVPGDLPEPADLFLSQASPGDTVKGIETKYGYLDLTVHEVLPAKTPLDSEKRFKIRGALSMTMGFDDLKFQNKFFFDPVVALQGKENDEVGGYEGRAFTVGEVSRGIGALPDSEERVPLMKRYVEEHFLEDAFADELAYLRKISRDLAAAGVYERDYINTHTPRARKELEGRLEEAFLTDGKENRLVTLFPREQDRFPGVGETARYQGREWTVRSRTAVDVRKSHIEEYLMRELFALLVKQYPVEVHEE
jgi:hypothetical protein